MPVFAVMGEENIAVNVLSVIISLAGKAGWCFLPPPSRVLPLPSHIPFLQFPLALSKNLCTSGDLTLSWDLL